MKKMYKYIFGLALTVISLRTFAYEVSTHEMLTRHAVLRSVLAANGTLLVDLGLPAWDTVSFTSITNATSTTRPTKMNGLGIVIFGAQWEDDNYEKRAFNHFFDPQYSRPVGRGLDIPALAIAGNPSPDWALEDRGSVIDKNGGDCASQKDCPQLYSLKRAQQSLYDAMTKATAAERLGAASNALQSLGHVVHHIQDMAQPQHTRNEQHLHPLGTNGINLPFNLPWSYYELRTAGQNGTIDKMLENQRLSNTGYPIPKFSTARQFWHSADSATAQYVGMAEFTSNNFTSYAKQYTAIVGNPNYIGPAAGFPLPDGTGKRIVRCTTPITKNLNNVVIPAGQADCVMGPVIDGYTKKSQDVVLAMRSLIYMFTGSGKPGAQYPVFVESPITYDAAYPILMPRAVAFSAGLINHFFRGKLNLIKGASDNQWAIKNEGEDLMDGTFSIYSENSTGLRTLVAGTTLRASAVPGQSINLNLTAPSSTVKLIAVFRGQIGAEGDSSLSSGYYAVAGKTVAFKPSAAPTIPCGTPVSRSGGSGALSFIQELGNTAGKVTINFNTYSVPDGLEITPDNNKQVALVSSKGLVAGTHTYTFDHQPSVRNSTKVNVTVNGNPNSTIWNLTMSCPGAQAPAVSTVRVRFDLTNPNSPGSCFLRYNLTIDGKSVGFPGYADMVPGEAHIYRLIISGTACSGSKLPYYQDNTGQHMMDSTAQQTFWVQ